MKRTIRPITLVLIAFAMFVVSAAPAANAQLCSISGAVGAYGFTATGTLLPSTGPVLIAAVGRINLRLDGSLDGTEARNVGGDFANETLKGTWTVNPSCTGTVTAQIFESGVLVRTSVLSFVIDDNQQEVRSVQKSLTLPDGTKVPAVVTFEAKRMF